jgi:hypothetical protein
MYLFIAGRVIIVPIAARPRAKGIPVKADGPSPTVQLTPLSPLLRCEMVAEYLYVFIQQVCKKCKALFAASFFFLQMETGGGER